MSVVSLLPNYWDNSDGLRVRFPGSATTLSRGGCYPLSDGRNMVEVFIDLGSLPTAASGNEQIQLEDVVIPAGAFIERVEVFVTAEPATSGSPNLDLGFVKTDRSTELDFNGLLAATDTLETGTDLGSNAEYTKGSTEVGALVGTVLAYDGILTASPDTADWTAGQYRVRIYYSMNRSADTTA